MCRQKWVKFDSGGSFETFYDGGKPFFMKRVRFERNTVLYSEISSSRNNGLSRYNEVRGDDAVMQVSIEKSRYNELSRNNEVKGAPS